MDVLTLSGTHLSSLLPILNELFPEIIFLNPLDSIAEHISNILKNKRSNKNRMRVFTSGNINKFHQQLKRIGIKNKINPL